MDLNCAGLEREFLETELFGHERGAFTGAVQAKPGLLEVADRGTVFLDEIGDIDMTVQPKLLKVLEAHQFRRLGDVHDRTVDIRLISATHRDLKELVRQQRFREDLFFRITIIPIRIPPLRERLEDIPLLASDILRRISSPNEARRDRTRRHRDDGVAAIPLAREHSRDAQRAGTGGADRAASSAHGEGPGTAVSGKPRCRLKRKWRRTRRAANGHHLPCVRLKRATSKQCYRKKTAPSSVRRGASGSPAVRCTTR